MFVTVFRSFFIYLISFYFVCLCAVPTKVKTIKKEYLLKRLFMMRGNSLFWHGGLGHRQLFQGVEVRKPPYTLVVFSFFQFLPV